MAAAPWRFSFTVRMTKKRLIYLFVCLFLCLFVSLHITAELTFSVKPELGPIKWFVLTQVLVLVGLVPPQPGFSQGLRNTQARVSEGVCLVCR